MEQRNPLKEIREKSPPTQAEIDNRNFRDKGKTYLLQRELADRIGCSEYCIQQCEKAGRFPEPLEFRVPAQKFHAKLTSEPHYDDGGLSLADGVKRLTQILAL